MCAQRCFKCILSGDDVKVAGGEGAAGIKFSGRATHEDGRVDALRIHMLADGREDFERSGKFGAVALHGTNRLIANIVQKSLEPTSDMLVLNQHRNFLIALQVFN